MQVLKEYGFAGFHYATESDQIDLVCFLNVKHLGIFKRPLSPTFEDRRNDRDKPVSLQDEIELLAFEM
ncbi:MAG: hypothetical protein IJK64_00650 [Clostridia bacterium]|nr:hypothetical protein [Clostridia bacterium]